MSNGSFWTPGKQGIGIIVIAFLVSVAYPWCNKKKIVAFIGGNQKSVEAAGLFPLDTSLSVIFPKDSTKKKVNFRSFFQNGNSAILVNFWATWCPPCIDELPAIEFLHRRLALNTNEKTPQLITVSVDEKAEEVAKLFKNLSFQTSFVVLHDPEGELARSLGTTKFPETFLVSKSGKVIYKWLGPQNWLGFTGLSKIINGTIY